MKNDDSAWDILLKTAILGLQRSDLPALRTSGALADALAALEVPVGERWSSQQFLQTAAVLAMHRRAGRLPARRPNLTPSRAPAETLTRCSPAAARLLRRLVAEMRLDLLVEWAALAAERGARLPEEDLPILLSLCKNHPRLNNAMLPVLGERGRWLAQQNPEWHAVVPVIDFGAWQDGSSTTRREFLELLRTADPERARTLLKETWGALLPAERADLLGALRENLSGSDEDFLETALHDPDPAVCAEAARLLVGLPTSRMVQRISAAALQAARWKFGLLRGTVEINPRALDPADEANLLPLPVEEPWQGSAKAALLAKLVSAVPTHHWQSAWNKPPAAIVQANFLPEWEDSLIAGWTEAALRHGDTAWLNAIIAYESRRADEQRLFGLFQRLPYSLQEQMLLPLFSSASPSLENSSITSILLSACSAPWSTSLSEAVIRAIVRNMQLRGTQLWHWKLLLRRIGPRFHPDTLEEAIQSLSNAQRQYVLNDPFIKELLEVLTIRRDIRRVFSSIPGEPQHEPH